MKLFNKLAVCAALAALALGACDTGLTPAGPDLTEVNKAYSANGVSKISWAESGSNSVIPTITAYPSGGGSSPAAIAKIPLLP
jgi:hypothetical protein